LFTEYSLTCRQTQRCLLAFISACYRTRAIPSLYVESDCGADLAHRAVVPSAVGLQQHRQSPFVAADAIASVACTVIFVATYG